jgi:hypothetical protein
VADDQYWHLSGARLAPGAVIEPGNFGRIVMAIGKTHPHFHREMAIEYARVAKFASRPSRLTSAFGFVTSDEAADYRARIPALRSLGSYSRLDLQGRYKRP